MSSDYELIAEGRYPSDAEVIADRPKSWAAAPPSKESDELTALLAAERSIGRLEGAKHEREASQTVMSGMAAVAAAGWVLAFCVAVWK